MLFDGFGAREGRAGFGVERVVVCGCYPGSSDWERPGEELGSDGRHDEEPKSESVRARAISEAGAAAHLDRERERHGDTGRRGWTRRG